MVRVEVLSKVTCKLAFGMSDALLQKVYYEAFWYEITLATQEARGNKINEELSHLSLSEIFLQRSKVEWRNPKVKTRFKRHSLRLTISRMNQRGLGSCGLKEETRKWLRMVQRGYQPVENVADREKKHWVNGLRVVGKWGCSVVPRKMKLWFVFWQQR